MNKNFLSIFTVAVMATSMLASVAVRADAEAFDDYARPVIVTDRALKVAYMHTKPQVESQSRSIMQTALEAEKRGWDYVELTYNTDAEWADTFNNAINQSVDAIIIGSTENMEAKQSLIDQARNAGIGIYCNDNQVIPGVIMNSTMPNGVAAESLIYKIGNDYNWTGKICYTNMSTIQVHNERILPIQGTVEAYSNMENLETIDSTAGGSDQQTYVADSAKAWFQKYGTDLTGVIGSCDYIATPVAEAAEQSGDLVNPDFFVAGIDGGSECWAYIRGGGYFKYSYAQPFEMFTHKVCEAVDQLQVQGLKPGDDGCILSYAGEILYTEGVVVSRDNVPEVGANINSVYDFYDDDPDAWYNWDGMYTVQE